MDIMDCELSKEVHECMVLIDYKRKWGFCFVDECPVTEQATQELLERIAFIRHTHYGSLEILCLCMQWSDRCPSRWVLAIYIGLGNQGQRLHSAGLVRTHRYHLFH